MSEKNRDNKNRWRNVTIAFRMSPEENEELDLRVKLCGYQTRQEYIIESVLHQKVTAVGNPLMLVQFRKQLRGIEEELKRLTTLEDADEELFTPIRTMLEILNAFKGVLKMVDLKDYQKIMENIGIRQMIFQGPPGTSKTFESKKFVLSQLNPSASSLTKAFTSQEDISNDLDQYKLTDADYANPTSSTKFTTGGWDLVQFHPSYGYEDFIRGIADSLIMSIRKAMCV